MGKTRIQVIINSISASRLQQDPAPVIMRTLDRNRFEVSIRKTTKKGDATIFAKEAIEKGFPLIVAAGGDGTINEVASVILGSDCLLGIIPIGSGNGLARSLGIPLSVKRSAEVINQMKDRHIDTGSVNGRPFFSIAGTGFDARVAHRYQQEGGRGFISYFRIAAKELITYKPRSFKIEIDGQILKRKAFLVSISNSGQFGYNTVIAPNARLDDGYLDIVITRDIPVKEIPRLLYRLITKTIYKADEIEIYKGKNVVIRRKRGKRINLDGESVKSRSRLNIRVNPRSLRVVAP